jgi:hypothetical protein
MAFAGNPRFSIRFQFVDEPKLWGGWTKQIMKDLGQVVANSTRDRIQKDSRDGFNKPLGVYKSNVGRNRKTKGRRGKPITLTDKGRMLKTWKPRNVQKTRVRITSLAKYAEGVNARYQWAWIDDKTMEALTERFNFHVESLMGGIDASPAKVKGKRVQQGQPVTL